jgi:hypothetical protein
MNGKTGDHKKLVYICAPLKGDIAGNIAKVREHCKTVLSMGCIPIAPHVMFDGVLNDDNPHERQTALDMGLELVTRCNELWIFTKIVSQGMQDEIDLAKRIGIPVKRVCFNFERKAAPQQPTEAKEKEGRSAEAIIADMKRQIHEVGPEDVTYCLQDCTLCNEGCRAWCGMSALEGELFRALAGTPKEAPAE